MTWIAAVVGIFGVAGVAALVWAAWRSYRGDRDELILLRAKIKADARVREELIDERQRLLRSIEDAQRARDAERQAAADMARRDPGLAPGYLADSLRYVAGGAQADLGQQVPVPGEAPAKPADVDL